MSDNQVCELWCLVDHEQEPFFVEASLRWNMDQLKKAIRQEKRHLRNLDVSEIVLRKVRRLSSVNVRAHSPFQLNNPIPIDPEPTLPQRLLSSYTDDCSVQLDRRTRQVSDVFPGDLAKNHIQIIVIVKTLVTGELHTSTAFAVLPRHSPFVILQVHLR